MTSNSVILYGDKEQFKEIFNDIKQHKPSSNQVIIADDLNTIKLITKYYKANLSCEFYEKLTEVLENQIKNDDFHGIIVYLNDNLDLVDEKFKGLFDKSEKKILKLVIINKFNSLNEEKQNDLNKFCDSCDFYLLKLDDEDEDIIDELLNSLFVYEWPHKLTDNISAAKAEVGTSVVKTEESEENFENFLLNLQDMRLKALQMDAGERKTYAENVVKQFWSVIGGDENELLDLDSDSDQSNDN